VLGRPGLEFASKRKKTHWHEKTGTLSLMRRGSQNAMEFAYFQERGEESHVKRGGKTI